MVVFVFDWMRVIWPSLALTVGNFNAYANAIFDSLDNGFIYSS